MQGCQYLQCRDPNIYNAGVLIGIANISSAGGPNTYSAGGANVSLTKRSHDKASSINFCPLKLMMNEAVLVGK